MRSAVFSKLGPEVVPNNATFHWPKVDRRAVCATVVDRSKAELAAFFSTTRN